MLIFERKPFEEIFEVIKGKKKILLLGCGTCPSVRLAGGEREVALLASQIRLFLGDSIEVFEATVKRQCDIEFFDEVKKEAQAVNQVLSLACGMGAQLATEQLGMLVFPANNTSFIGTPVEQGVWEERCRACGDCIVHFFGGICPITRCAKSLLNGPCGGSQDGKCEVSVDTPCAWQLIYERLKALGKLDLLEKNYSAKDWSKSHIGEPGKIVRDDLRIKQE